MDHCRRNARSILPVCSLGHKLTESPGRYRHFPDPTVSASVCGGSASHSAPGSRLYLGGGGRERGGLPMTWPAPGAGRRRGQGALPPGGRGQSGRDVDVPVEGVIRARRTTERRPDLLGITPANDNVFADQRMVRIWEHKDHMIAVTDVAGHWCLGAESNPAGRERGDRDRGVPQLLAQLIGGVLGGGRKQPARHAHRDPEMATAIKDDVKHAPTGPAEHVAGCPAEGVRILSYSKCLGVPTMGARDNPAPVVVEKDVGGL